MDTFEKDMEFLAGMALKLSEEEPDRDQTVFDQLREFGIDLDEDHKDFQDMDDLEFIDLTDPKNQLVRKNQDGHVLTEEELKDLDGLEDMTGVPGLGSLLSDFVKNGGQVIGLGPGESLTMGI